MISPIAAGFLVWRGVLRRRPDGERIAATTARFLSHGSILGTITPVLVLVFWAADLRSNVSLAAVGLLAFALGGALAWGGARAAGLDRSLQGTCFLAGSCSNILTLGGLTTVILLAPSGGAEADRALASIAIYRILEAPYYYLVAWPVAAWIARGRADERTALRRAVQPVTLVPMAAMIAGIALNLARVPRPPWADGIAEIFVKVNVLLLGAMVGLTLRSARPIKHLGRCLGVCAVKFALVPAAAVAAAWLLGHRGQALQVVAICTSMPVAFMALVGANLYRLEEELISSMWLFTTGAMMAVVPLLAFVVPWVGRL
jgi:predicted permease